MDLAKTMKPLPTTTKAPTTTKTPTTTRKPTTPKPTPAPITKAPGSVDCVGGFTSYGPCRGYQMAGGDGGMTTSREGSMRRIYDISTPKKGDGRSCEHEHMYEEIKD